MPSPCRSVPLLAALLLPLLCPPSPSPAAPPGASVRDRRLMDFGWKFHLADGALPGESITPVANWKWTPVEGAPGATPPTLDSSWKDAAPNQDVFGGRVGYAWYSTTLPASKATGQVIVFEAVDDNATVFLNGKKIGSHEGWSEAFELPLDGAWNAAGPNVLTVLVENTAGIGGIKGASVRLATATVASPAYDDSGWRTVDVPHDFVLEQPLDPGTDANFGFHRGAVAWYRRHFTPPVAPKGQRTWLEFDGVYRDAKVFLNGHPLGSHSSGYTSFYFDATDYIVPGKENVLAVRADATSHEGWWYEGGGIYRHVWLTNLSPIHVAHWGIFASSNVIGKLPAANNKADAFVHVTASVTNESGTTVDARIDCDIVDADGRIVWSHGSGYRLKPGTTPIPNNAAIPQMELWSVDRPYLYQAVTTILVHGEPVDRVVTPLGVRHIRFDPDHGFFLNGSPVKIKGTCNHQDFAGIGIALPDRVHEYKIEKLKEMGSNAYRCSHHQYAEEILDACDRLGMLVMDENRHLGESEKVLDEAATLVLRDRNHPSVILWSVCNEEAQQGTEEGRRKAQAIKDVFNKYDGTRPVTAAMQASWGQGISNVIDVQGFNYFPEQYDPYHKSHPKQPLIGSETGSILTTRSEYKQDDVRGYMSSYSDGAERAWRPIAEREFMAGAFVWTGFDYRGEPTPFGWPNLNSHFGIMDTCGFPKDDYYYYQAAWSDKPVLHLLPHWNWAYPRRGETEQNAQVEVRCYTNCDHVELFVNGKSQGTKPADRTAHLTWKVKWNPGEISAKGWKDGKEVATTKIETAGDPAAIQLSADRSAFLATGEDVAMVSAQLLDAAGHAVPMADDAVTFAVTSGDARLLGTGNGDPSDHTADASATRRTFHGRCLAIVHTGTRAGAITITASAPGLPPATLQFNLQPATPRPRVD